MEETTSTAKPPVDVPAFPAGDYYSCTDPEHLSCTAPEEAIEQHLDADLDPKMTVSEVIASIRARPVTVTAYRPRAISDKQIDAWADNLLETLAEHFDDEHSDPDDEPGSGFPDDATQVMRDAVKSIIRRSHVWSCEAVGAVTLTPDQIEAVMRDQCPDWFEEEAAPSSPVVRLS